MDGAGSPDPVSWEFTPQDLRRVRQIVARVAGVAGIPAAGVGNLVWAVNELTTNAIVHGGGRGRVTITTTAHGVRVAVTDWGPGLPGPISDALPTLPELGGRGLWLTRHLYPEMTVTTGPAGTTVSVHASR
jgi:anti-sigma regulatory factor (Ser/Thr protein kinase)